MASLNIQAYDSIHQIDAAAWDQLSAGRPFQSHRWYVFGEQVMSDCTPVYLLASQAGVLVGRASLWLVKNDPLPQMLGRMKKPAETVLKNWPLLICRSPLASTTGLILSEAGMRPETLSALTDAITEKARQLGASFILFDYLPKADLEGWPSRFKAMNLSTPGTVMENRWDSLEAYLLAGDKKDRQHYKRTIREADKLGIQIASHPHAERLEEALPIIREVETGHGASPNPWVRRMLENMEMVDGTFLTAIIDQKLVGCGLLLEDNGAQMTSTLGLTEVPYVYFMLIYESLKMAFEHQVRLLRWGSGAYEVKEQLGFSFEDNGSLTFTAVNPAVQRITSLFL
jgi:predicted N-acyltransferase